MFQRGRFFFWLLFVLPWITAPWITACGQVFPSIPNPDTPPPSTLAVASHPPVTATIRKSNQVTPAPPTAFSHIGIQPDELRGTIIKFWHPWTGAAGDVMEALIETFNLNNEWGIVVVPTAQASLDEMYTKVKSAMQNGEPPDLVVGYPHQYLAWDAEKRLVDLRPYVEDAQWGYNLEDQADFYPVFWEQDVFEGRRLGIPALRSGQVLYYNTTLAKELGYAAAPVLPDQFKEQACAAALTKQQDSDPQNDSTGGWIISSDYPALLGWIYSFGGEVIKTPEPGLDESVYQFASPQVEEAFTFLRGLYDQGCAWLAESQYPEAEFAGRMGLFSTGSLTDIPYQMEAFQKTGSRDEWTVIPFPSPSLEPGLDVYGPSYVMLPSVSEEQLASWLLMKWLSEPKNQVRMVEATGAFPLRASALKDLDAYQNRHPQWAAALKMLPSARNEPAFQSWSTVRWALSEAGTQLFRSYFTIDQVPNLIEYLERTAGDLHIGPELSGVYHTPTFTPTASSTPTRTRIPSATPTFTRTPRATP